MAEASLIQRLFGRSRRREFWLCIAGVFVAGLIGRQLGPVSHLTGWILSPFELWFCVRRLHDVNASGLWVFALFAAVFGLPFLIAYATPWGASDVRLYAVGIAGLVWLGFFVVLGLIPGTKGANRFGPAHGKTAVDASVFD